MDQWQVLLRRRKRCIGRESRRVFCRLAQQARIAKDTPFITASSKDLPPTGARRPWFLAETPMKMRMNIAVRGLFATPVAALEVPNAEARNAELMALILKRRGETPSVQASNAGGWHSDREIMEWGGTRVGEILDIAKEIANRMTADRHGKPVRPVWSVMAWANVNGPGDANICHYHPGAFWSGAYYVEDGGCGSDPALGGEFEMLDPRGAGPGMYAPTLKFASEDGQSAGAAETVHPRPGLLFLFPSWLFHQVRPYRGTGLRISIAFNLSV
jgi:uncharacterized protein (TIGR02466 family)